MTIVLATHYTLSEALLGAAEMILGPQSNVHTLTFLPDEGSDALRERMEQVIKECSTEVLVLADLPGGTPANVATALSVNYPVHIVTGINMPMLLEVLLQRDTAPVRELIELAQKSGTAGITEVSLNQKTR